MSDELTARLRQRGRAAVDFIGNLSIGARPLKQLVDAEARRIIAEAPQLPNDLDQLDTMLEQTLADQRPFRVSQAVAEWHATYHGLTARDAFEEIRSDVEPVIARFEEGPATLETDPDLDPPAYWDGVNFHRTHGGWDEHEFQGYIHGEIVHSRMVNTIYPGGIFKQRRMIAEMAPRDHYNRILDMGCSTGHFTRALQETYPQAEIHGVDLSAKTLEQARRQANANNWSWHLYQRPAEATGFEDDSFDLVASYILLHELPAERVRAVFREAFRVARPGGDMIMSDVTRYADLDTIGIWHADRGAKYGGEPHWRESASLDLAEVAREAGFVDIVAEGLGPMKYPHVVRGRKPE